MAISASWIAVALLAGGVGYLALAAFVWANRRVAASTPLVVMLLAVKVWSLCYALELVSRSAEVAQWWSALKFVGIVALPPALWAFVWEYTGRGRLPWRWLALLLVHPVLVMASFAVPATRTWLHKYPALMGDPERQRWVLHSSPYPETGYWLYAHLGYTAIVMFAAVFTLTVQLAKIAPAYRRAGTVLILASVLPFVGNLTWVAVVGTATVDPTPFLFGVTAVVLVWGFFRLRLLKLVPIARSTVIEQMSDGVLVLDVYGRVVDANPSASELLAREWADMVGLRADLLLPALEPMLAGYTPGTQPESAEVTIRRVDAAVPDRTIEVSLNGVTDTGGRETARLVMLHDVTDRRQAERRLRELLDEQTKLSETLQQGLRPARLPDVAGVRLVARSIAASRGGVSGDFYDVHPAGPGRSAFVLGDVSGKGVHAAVVTSMARYTVRTLSAQGLRPRQVLEHLNQALLGPDDPERFCTVVYGQLEPGPVDEAGAPTGMRVTIALGGHPPPLLRQRDRRVQPVGRPGTVLGLVPRVEIFEVRVDLAPGDVLLAYTDGVTEARDGDELFGEERLARVLSEVGPDLEPTGRSTPVRGIAGLRRGNGLPIGVPGARDSDEGDAVAARYARDAADAVADGVLEAVRSFASYRDDVALLVLAVP